MFFVSCKDLYETKLVFIEGKGKYQGTYNGLFFYILWKNFILGCVMRKAKRAGREIRYGKQNYR